MLSAVTIWCGSPPGWKKIKHHVVCVLRFSNSLQNFSHSHSKNMRTRTTRSRTPCKNTGRRSEKENDVLTTACHWEWMRKKTKSGIDQMPPHAKNKIEKAPVSAGACAWVPHFNIRADATLKMSIRCIFDHTNFNMYYFYRWCAWFSAIAITITIITIVIQNPRLAYYFLFPCLLLLLRLLFSHFSLIQCFFSFCPPSSSISFIHSHSRWPTRRCCFCLCICLNLMNKSVWTVYACITWWLLFCKFLYVLDVCVGEWVSERASQPSSKCVFVSVEFFLFGIFCNLLFMVMSLTRLNRMCYLSIYSFER